VRKLAGGKRVENVDDVLGVGQKILVEITKIDDRGKLSLAPVLAEDADTDGRGAEAEHALDPAEGVDA
jgi:polyribonucleotide nucleotidyltransferase